VIAQRIAGDPPTNWARECKDRDWCWEVRAEVRAGSTPNVSRGTGVAERFEGDSMQVDPREEEPNLCSMCGCFEN